jgi:Ran GTPase-activating protein (RanGAP) involved in mRNA processing and transport
MYLTYNSAYKRLKNNDPKLTSLGIGVYVYSATELNNILAALKNNRSCRNLSIYHIGDKIHEDAGHYLSEIIKYNVTLVNLTVELPCFFQDQNFIEFIDALKNNTTLQKLSLISQPFNSEHIEHFSESLLKNTSIKYLELQDTNINDKGAVKFASALYKHKKLQHLNLSSNPIGDVGFVALVDSITEKHLLNTLYFHHCDIGDEGVKGLAKALLRSNMMRE